MLGLSLCLLLLATCAETTASKTGASPSDAAPLPECAIPRATENIAIDGDLAEDAWAATPVIDQFSFPWRTQGAKDRTEAGGKVTSSISPGPTPKSPNPNSTRPNALASRASSTDAVSPTD
jgi:hypothetical protein